MSTVGSTKRLMLNVWKAKCEKELREKTRKKGLLIKMIDSNSNRSEKLVDILKEPSGVNTSASSTDNSKSFSEAEFLRKYHESSKGGPNHSIAQNRAHHLTNFLSQYLINAFQSGYFTVPVPTIGPDKQKFIFEISNVELPTDLRRLKVYWHISGDEAVDSAIEASFERGLKNQIRSTLTNERVMSYVPQIEFIRDNTQATLRKLDEYLMQIKKENSKEMEKEETVEEEIPKNQEEKKVMVKNVDNLFGINIVKLSAAVKMNPEYKEWRAESNVSLPLAEPKSTEITVLPSEPNKFAVSLKAFQVNQFVKRRQKNKSGMQKMIDFYDAVDNQKF